MEELEFIIEACEESMTNEIKHLERELLNKGIWIPEIWNPYENDFPYTLEIDNYSELRLIKDIFSKYYNN